MLESQLDDGQSSLDCSESSLARYLRLVLWFWYLSWSGHWWHHGTRYVQEPSPKCLHA